MAILQIELKKCRDNGIDCPYSYTQRTPNSGFAIDYYCSAVKPLRITSGYVECYNDVKPVPIWCPFRVDKDQLQKEANERIMGEGI